MNDAGVGDALAVDHDPFSGPELLAFAPVTASQREVWLACEIEPAVNVGYNEGLLLRLDGPLDVEALKASLQALVVRHEALRSCFSPDGEWLCVLAPQPLDIPLLDVDDAALTQCTRAAMAEPFDLAAGPLLRLVLLRLAPQRHRLMFIAHHAICDGWSGAVILSELGALYSARIAGRDAALAPAPRYTDYAAQEAQWLASDEGQRHRRYWLAQLQPLPVPLDLPADRPRGQVRRFSADRIDVRFPEALVTRLRRLGAEHGASLVATLLAGFTALLHRLTRAEDLTIGLAAAGQSLHDQPGLVGHCVNLLPLRLRPTPRQTFAELLREARGVVLDAHDHQGVSFGTLLGELPLQRDSMRPTLIPVVFNVDVRDDDLSHDGLDVGYDTLVRQAENFELYVNLVDNGRDLVLEASYSDALFDAATVERWITQYRRLLEAACDDPSRSLTGLPLIDDAARRRVMAWSHGPQLEIPPRGLYGLFAEQSAQHPDAPAVVCGGATLSYAQVALHARRVAAALAGRGVGRGDFVAVCLERRAELPGTLLGVLASGAAYLPLDPDLPPARLRFMFDDAGARLLIAERGTAHAVDAAPDTLLLEARADEQADPAAPPGDDPALPAYAIYTSGTSGQPKGVVTRHRSAVNTLCGLRQRMAIGPGDRIAAVATIAFDASVLEIFVALTSGAALVLATHDEAHDGAALARRLDSGGVTHLFCAPSAWQLLLAAGWAGHPALVGTSWAEPLPRDLARALLPRLRELWNIYGPTETAILMLAERIVDADAPIMVGRPIANMRAWIVAEDGTLQPPGVTGELWIGGIGVADGYLNRAELSAEKFVPDPFEAGQRAYRSGDLARWSDDGRIECLGRADMQIKLRGFRIEPGEIEVLLRELPEVAEAACAVALRGPDDPRLVAWVAGHAGAPPPEASALRRALRARLPGYMVPQHFVALSALPRLVNGKLDRRALPDPFADEAPTAGQRSAPRTDAERAVHAVWAEVLGHAEFGIEDRFLDVGGHSLLAVQVAAALERRFGRRPSLRTVMGESLAALAQTCAADGVPPAPAAASAPPPRTAADAPPPDDRPASPAPASLSRLLRWLTFRNRP